MAARFGCRMVIRSRIFHRVLKLLQVHTMWILQGLPFREKKHGVFSFILKYIIQPKERFCYRILSLIYAVASSCGHPLHLLRLPLKNFVLNWVTIKSYSDYQEALIPV